ncbi:MAG TPA: thioredoxin family protein [Actinomycetaceae bacterium]|nr:thioredoxin family protein [Actinomycetaceae bacterium]
MTTTEITQENFEATVADGGIVLLYFWADWCFPCRSFGPVYDSASAENPDIVFGKVDTEAEQQLAGGFGITSIPTVMAFRDGVLVFSQPGALKKAGLAQLIEAVRGLDMDDVRSKLAAQSAESGTTR